MRRLTLDNGLRVVLDPRPMAPAVGMAVHYAVGFRNEPEGRSGFAHLFEHMMFQGSRNTGPSEHFRHVQAVGGTSGASTHQDYTDFYQVCPTSALERMLFLEADRMASLWLTQRNLRTQLSVVKEEVRANVTNRAYGGFPWTVLPAVLYGTFPNAHNGYGHFGDLDRATLDDCQAFHYQHYAPGNAVLTISGSFAPDRVTDMIERHFGRIPARPVPSQPLLCEPPLTGERRGTHHDAHAALPAVALGYRMPDPVIRRADYLAHVVLSLLLTGGENARLTRRLVREGGVAASVRTGCGFFGPLQARHPDTFHLVAAHPPHTAVDDVLGETDAILADLAATGPDEPELARALARSFTAAARGYDNLLVRTRHTGAFEVLHGRAELVDELPYLLRAVDAEQVARAAGGLAADARGVLALTPAVGALR
ncbi:MULTISPECIES: M16 family metallopeptidase [Streptomyces]|uniref:M16 family metallopeptidase n=1 Tax=Streptomyces TaxID=1883 RepID=UPI001E449A00|nr:MULTISPECIES: pitrilysin family protein [Streptomyces]UFQ16861.1 insulinase family protein [Streptomyces huasconensis]WCL86464.1 pitrilysin family protein [Streptomyces sp. JCM 35825]